GSCFPVTGARWKMAKNLPLAGDREAPGMGTARFEQPRLKLIDRPGPTWRVVVFLALPVLVQQFLTLSVSLSDRFLAGRLEPLPRAQQTEALSHSLAAIGLAGGALLPGNGMGNALAADVSLEAAMQ